MKAKNLLTEYLTNPIGIDIESPRLFWNCEDGIKQAAYQILAKDNTDKLLWDSGKIESSSMHTKWGGNQLASRTRVTWKVRLWDENNVVGDWSQTAYFEMGLLNPSDWRAKWISGNYKAKRKPLRLDSAFVKQERYPVDSFRKFFEATEIVRARMYVTACGIYQGKLNGQRIGDYVFAPGHTDYHKRIQYQVYDVLPLLKQGQNELTFELADGWFRGSQGAWGQTKVYGHQTKLLCQLEIADRNGNIKHIVSDNSFHWSNDGCIRFADLKDGESVDANLSPSYKDKSVETKCNSQLVCSNNFSVVERERFVPQLITTSNGKSILDFKQNISGYIEFNIKAKKGQKIILLMGEMLDEDGEFTQKNIQLSRKGKTTPLQKIEYICKEGINNYKTKFAMFGFRYALIETDIEFSASNFAAIAVYSDMHSTLSFSSSNDLLNRFVHATVWSMKSNSADVPTDCPTRERSGWTGDAQIFFNTAGYLMNYAPFARKFIKDMTDRQSKNGKFHQIVPKGGEDFWMTTMNGSVGWACAGVLIPYRMWKLFGDDSIIEDNYEAMKGYANFMIRRAGKLGLFAKPLMLPWKVKKYAVNKGQSYGEWAEPADVRAFSIGDFVAPHPEESTAYTNFTLSHFIEIAEYLKKDKDLSKFYEYKEGAKAAYSQLVKKPKFSLDTDRQAKLVRPLYMKLLDKEQSEFAKKRLIKALDNYDWRIGTGFLSTPLILDVLADIDIEYAYKLLENEQEPGWLFMPKMGATTIWESWEGTEAQGGVASLNHYSKGAVCEWLFRVMCGINISGENRFTISPRHGGNFTFAEAKYDSVYGTVSCAWKKEKNVLVYNISIPPNTTAQVVLPDGRKQILQCGNYTF